MRITLFQPDLSGHALQVYQGLQGDLIQILNISFTLHFNYVSLNSKLIRFCSNIKYLLMFGCFKIPFPVGLV